MAGQGFTLSQPPNNLSRDTRRREPHHGAGSESISSGVTRVSWRVDLSNRIRGLLSLISGGTGNAT